MLIWTNLFVILFHVKQYCLLISTYFLCIQNQILIHLFIYLNSPSEGIMTFDVLFTEGCKSVWPIWHEMSRGIPSDETTKRGFSSKLYLKSHNLSHAIILIAQPTLLWRKKDRNNAFIGITNYQKGTYNFIKAYIILVGPLILMFWLWIARYYIVLLFLDSLVPIM